MTEYRPNEIPRVIRVFNVLWATFLSALCVYALVNGSLVYPGVRGSGPVALSGLPLVFFCIGLICGAANAVLVIIDHYDKRNNEAWYKRLTKVLNLISVAAIVLAFGYQFVVS